jgi:hypothetical protein
MKPDAQGLPGTPEFVMKAQSAGKNVVCEDDFLETLADSRQRVLLWSASLILRFQASKAKSSLVFFTYCSLPGPIPPFFHFYLFIFSFIFISAFLLPS